MKKSMVLAMMAVVLLASNAWAGIDGSIFTDKVQTTIKVESWWIPVAEDITFGGYGKVNVPRTGDTNFVGEVQTDYLPLKVGPIKLGVEANMQLTYPSKTEVIGRGYLAAKVGPFLLRYSPIQTDGNHKLSVCWFQKWNKFGTFGYYDRYLNQGQLPLNKVEGYIGYSVAENVMITIGAKPAWSDGQNPKINPGVGIRIKF